MGLAQQFDIKELWGLDSNQVVTLNRGDDSPPCCPFQSVGDRVTVGYGPITTASPDAGSEHGRSNQWPGSIVDSDNATVGQGSQTIANRLAAVFAANCDLEQLGGC